MPLIEVRDLRFRYADGTQALNGVDFQLQEGETAILLGPNGSGKTTFVLHLNGLLKGQGDIQICGLPLKDSNLPAIRRKIGLVFQDADEQLFMPSVLEDVAFGPLNQGLSAEAALRCARESLKRVGMEAAEARAPYHLSAGEKRRVAIAGVLAMAPDVLVFDEPTMFLDPPGQRELIHILKGLPQAKIVITHDAEFAKAVGTRAAFFERGRISAEGSISDLISRFRWSCW